MKKHEIKIRYGIPIPPAYGHVVSVIRTMKVGGMVDFPKARTGTFYSAAKRCGFKVVTRKMANGLTGMWRIK